MALMGSSGCGKSTLLKLLSRLYVPDKGSVQFGGVELNEVDQIHTFVAMDQSAVSFNKTIRETLLFGIEEAGLPKPSNHLLEKAATVAEVLGEEGRPKLDLPDGLDTKVFP